MNARHILLYLLHQPAISIGNLCTSDTHRAWRHTRTGGVVYLLVHTPTYKRSETLYVSNPTIFIYWEVVL